MGRMKPMTKAALAGTAGAVAVNVVHESARQVLKSAPHMDFIGMRALGKGLQSVGRAPTDLLVLRRWTLVGDLIANSLYYSAVSIGKSESYWSRGFLLGLAAGVGGVVLPPRMGLGQQKSEKPWITFGLTIGWYLLGGLVAAGVAQALSQRSSDSSRLQSS